MRAHKMVTVFDTHAGGDVSRVVTAGGPSLPDGTMLAKMRHMAREADWLRRLLLCEPRGAMTMSADLILPPTAPAADAGVIIMESMGYPAMSGSNIICVATVLLETGMLPMTEPETRLTLETPGGLVPVSATCRNGRCERVRFENLPAFAPYLDASIEVAGLGIITADVAFGGVFYAIVDARALDFRMTADEAGELARCGRQIADAAAAQLDHVSLIRTHFYGEIIGTTRVGEHRAVRTAVHGQAWITAMQQMLIDPSDPFPEGYRLPDTWPD